jgi:hypothetical protein
MVTRSATFNDVPESHRWKDDRAPLGQVKFEISSGVMVEAYPTSLDAGPGLRPGVEWGVSRAWVISEDEWYYEHPVTEPSPDAIADVVEREAQEINDYCNEQEL